MLKLKQKIIKNKKTNKSDKTEVYLYYTTLNARDIVSIVEKCDRHFSGLKRIDIINKSNYLKLVYKNADLSYTNNSK